MTANLRTIKETEIAWRATYAHKLHRLAVLQLFGAVILCWAAWNYSQPFVWLPALALCYSGIATAARYNNVYQQIVDIIHMGEDAL